MLAISFLSFGKELKIMIAMTGPFEVNESFSEDAKIKTMSDFEADIANYTTIRDLYKQGWYLFKIEAAVVRKDAYQNVKQYHLFFHKD